MTIAYSCIANGRAVLAELTLTGGSYQVPLDRHLGLRRLHFSRVAPTGPAPQDGAPRGYPERAVEA